MELDTIPGNLLAYKGLELGTFQHVDQITTERRTNYGLRNQWLYTADGELYTVQKGKQLWAITREPQNLILQNIDEAYRQLIGQGEYFPDVEAAQASLAHSDTVVVDSNGLELVGDNQQYGHFVVNPKKVNELNTQQRTAAQRIYGPDEENFGLNMDMFAKAGKTPYVFVLMPGYVQNTLCDNDKKFLGRASWLVSFSNDSDFLAGGRVVNDHDALRGVRSVIAAGGDANKNEVPSVPQEIAVLPTMEEILACLGNDVAQSVRPNIESRIRKLYKQ